MKYLFCFAVFAICQIHFDSNVDMWHAVKKAVDYAEAKHLVYWTIAEDVNVTPTKPEQESVHSCWLCWKEQETKVTRRQWSEYG